MASSEIKDKTDITNARKEIERRMERFKVVEKEAKTKSFSKEGLNRAAADPRERARGEMRDWLAATVEALEGQIEEFEAEAESAATGAGGKKGKKPAPRVVHMEESISRHRQHITRLEQLLRLLDNDAVQGEPQACRLPDWLAANCCPCRCYSGHAMLHPPALAGAAAPAHSSLFPLPSLPPSCPLPARLFAPFPSLAPCSRGC